LHALWEGGWGKKSNFEKRGSVAQRSQKEIGGQRHGPVQQSEMWRVGQKNVGNRTAEETRNTHYKPGRTGIADSEKGGGEGEEGHPDKPKKLKSKKGEGQTSSLGKNEAKKKSARKTPKTQGRGGLLLSRTSGKNREKVHVRKTGLFTGGPHQKKNKGKGKGTSKVVLEKLPRREAPLGVGKNTAQAAANEGTGKPMG